MQLVQGSGFRVWGVEFSVLFFLRFVGFIVFRGFIRFIGFMGCTAFIEFKGHWGL